MARLLPLSYRFPVSSAGALQGWVCATCVALSILSATAFAQAAKQAAEQEVLLSKMRHAEALVTAYERGVDPVEVLSDCAPAQSRSSQLQASSHVLDLCWCVPERY